MAASSFVAKFAVLALLVGISHAMHLIGKRQSAGVRGRFVCNGQPASGVLLKLYDKDTGKDDLLAEDRTRPDGTIAIFGRTREIGKIDPEVHIFHNCGDKVKPDKNNSVLWKFYGGIRQLYSTLCQRKIVIGIPKMYVSESETPTQYYDLGQYELSGHPKGEERDCFH